MSRTMSGVALASLTAVLLTSGCREGERHEPSDHLPPGADAVVLDSATLARNAALEPGALATVVTDAVVGFTGPGEQPFEVARRSASPEAGHARRFGTITRSLVLRIQSPALTQYPCTSCHAGARVTMAAQREPDVHNDIQPVHPDTSGGVCATCHAPEDASLLVLLEGKRAPLDQSYRLCAQCHFQQAEAWAGGGHGKRLDGWQGRRVVMACADCHDPHHPGVEPRIPFRAPVLERTHRDDP